MKRQIIKIDENLCNGCGQCASSCAEGAIQMVDGKARLVSEIFCDGLGACLGECPVGAISIEEREAEPYDERKTLENLIPQGLKVVRLHLEHLKNHGEQKLYDEGLAVLKEKGIELPAPDFVAPSKPSGCPGSMGLPMHTCPSMAAAPSAGAGGKKNWPIQLQLINPDSAAFDDAELVIAADCTAFSLPDFYRQYTLDKTLIVFCPKLDHATEHYVEKLAAIFSRHDIRSLTVLRMLVPCCGGTSMIVRKALELSGKSISIEEKIIDFDGIAKSVR